MVAREGRSRQYQLQSLMVCVVVLSDVPLLQCWSEDGTVRNKCVARVKIDS